jgi:hypothetical protein
MGDGGASCHCIFFIKCESFLEAVKFITNINTLKYNSFIIFIFYLFNLKTKDLGDSNENK